MEQSPNEGVGIFGSEPHANPVANATGNMTAESRPEHRFRKPLAIGVAGATIVAAALYISNEHGANGNNNHTSNADPVASQEHSTIAVSDEAKKACAIISFTEKATDAKKFPGKSLLGLNTVSSVKDAASATRDRFGANGIFAGKASMVALATADSLVVIPALADKFNPKRDINADIQNQLNVYKSQSNNEVAQKDCEHLYDILSTTVSYENPAIYNGQKLGQAVPVKNSANETINVKLTNVPVGALDAESATVYRINSAAAHSGYKAFTPFLVNGPGEVFVEGEISETSNNNTQGAGTVPSPSPTPSPEQAASSQGTDKSHSKTNEKATGGGGNCGGCGKATGTNNGKTGGGGSCGSCGTTGSTSGTSGGSAGSSTGSTSGGTTGGTTGGTSGATTGGSTGETTGGTSGTSGGTTGGSTGETTGSTSGTTGTTGGTTGGTSGGTTGGSTGSPSPAPSPVKTGTPCDPNAGDVC